jgi:hypothetical protein
VRLQEAQAEQRKEKERGNDEEREKVGRITTSSQMEPGRHLFRLC